MTLYFSVLTGTRDRSDVPARLNERLRRRSARRAGRPPAPAVTAARVDMAHLGERLGLFVIIVLGEGMLLVVDSWAGDPGLDAGRRRGLALVLALAAGFAMLITLWALNVR